MTTVRVAIYNASDKRDPLHWALWLSSATKGDVILQVEDDKGGRGYYVADPVYGKEPARSTRLKETIECGTVPAGDHDTAVALAQNQVVDNVSKTWNCQPWVMEVLQTLGDAGILTLNAGAQTTLEGKLERRQ